MTVSWAEESKGINPVRGRLGQAVAIIVVANLLFPAVMGILEIFFEQSLSFLIWLFAAALLVTVLGYRQAADYGLSGLTGLAISAGLYFFFVTDWWKQVFYWLAYGDNALQGLVGTILLLSTVMLVGKTKALGLIKLLMFAAPVTMICVSSPDVWKFGSGVSPTESSSPVWNQFGSYSPLRASPVPRSPSEVPLYAVQDDFAIMAQLSADSPLYSGSLHEGELVQSEVLLPKGGWVLVLTEVEDRSGNRWLKVMLPFEGTRFNADRSELGFIPDSNIAGRVLVPAP